MVAGHLLSPSCLHDTHCPYICNAYNGLNADICMIFAGIWSCCQLYKDCSLFQYDHNKSAGWKLISVTENIVYYDKITSPITSTSASSTEAIIISDDVHSHELDVHTGLL